MLAPYFAAAFIAGPAFMVPMVLGQQRASFVFVLAGVVVNLAAFAAVYMGGQDVLGAFGVRSLVMSVCFAGYVAWPFRLLRRPEQRAA